MSIASEITRINTNIANAYTICNNKGATMPTTQNSANLANCIDSISGGSATLITKNITQNGTYNASSDNADGYSSVTVNVSGGGGGTKYGMSLDSILGDVNASGVLQTPSVDANLVFTGVTDIAQNGLYYKFSHNGKIKSCSFPNLTTLSGQRAMDSAFNGCTGLTNVNFNNLQTIGVDSSSTNYGQFSNCFYGCNKLTSITFPKLEKIYCTGGTSTSYGTFYRNNKVRKMYFPKLDTITYGTGASSSNQNACKNIFYGCAALTELHFGAANQAAIEASPGYSTAWGRGAGNVTIYFDL